MSISNPWRYSQEPTASSRSAPETKSRLSLGLHVVVRTRGASEKTVGLWLRGSRRCVSKETSAGVVVVGRLLLPTQASK